MTARTIDLNVFLQDAGYHESAWRLSKHEPRAVLGLDHYVELARIAERGILRSLFLADSPGLPVFRAESLPQARWDPVQLMSALASRTDHVALIPTASTTYNEPWDLARRIATLDVVSGGRAGWNAVTTVESFVAANFTDRPHPPREQRYRRADEFVAVVRRLWDGWEEDAVLADAQRGAWLDPARVHPVRHRGAELAVDGVLPVPRSPQGRPLIAQAGGSNAGVALAARHADVVFAANATLADGVAFRGRLRDATAAVGRSPDGVRVLPGVSFVLGGTESEAREIHADLEAHASSDFRWRNLAHMANIDHETIDPDAPFPPELLAEGPRTTIGGMAYALVDDPRVTFRELGARFAAMPGGLHLTGAPEQLADLIQAWWDAGACDGFTLMPMRLPEDLTAFVDHVVPILQGRGVADTEYVGRTARENFRLGPGPGGRTG